MKRFIVRYLPLGVLIAMASQLFADDDLCGNNFTGAPSAAPPSLHVGVILVQFSDWQGNVDSRGSHCQRHGEVNHYTVQEFNRHLFSQNIYRTPDPDDLNSEPRTHDREAIFGSMRDFYDENSYGKFLLTGEILNDSTFNEITEKWVPVWVTLNQTKGAWDSLGINPTRLLDSTLAVSGIDTTGFEKMILIYAGEERRDGLNPATSGNRFVYQIGEKKKGSSTRGRTNTPGTFYGIGTHCHEFGHLLFLPDLKGGSTQIRGLSEWDLMAVGNQGFMDGDPFNETIGGYHAPTHLGGWSKLCLGWANYEEFTEGNLTFPHFEEDDQICVYFINDSDPSNWDEGEYFIFENRRPTFSDGARTFDGDMHRDATVGGLLIVHHNDASPSQFSNGLDLKVIEADNNNSVGESVGAGNMADIYPGVNDNTEFSESSTPSSNDVDGNPTGLALLNITNNNGVVSTIVDFGPPAAPQNLVIANPSEDGANPILQWDANTEPDLNHYLVWRGTTPNWKTTPIT
nr:hypothetical protein [candidate division KSB1 bacterium]NIV70681.1 hypothetical protein [Phycisphaerae bacterium]NIS25102.1 hypothetical protein [candidate division KSB1 bacterium]NIT72014.1 hypothetical protein [candidate division KSB1 bacterium]NIU25801.1 hypothetical protein [candidate division KSB1 bacterium]